MATYQYQAKNRQGELQKGEMIAASNEEVAMHLMSLNLIPISVELDEKAQNLQGILDSFFKKDRIKKEDMVIFFRQMAVLTKSGVPILNGLQRLEETTSSAPLGKAIHRAIADITGGQTLTTAFSNSAEAFPPIVVSIIDAGENSGRLDLAFAELSQFFEMESKTMNRAKNVSRYPMIVFVSIVVAIITINFMVIPAFTSIFASFHTELPLPTRILIGISEFMRHYALLLLAASGAGFFWLRSFLRTSHGAIVSSHIFIRLPIIGKIIERIVLARFARTFAMVMASGVPLVKGITLSANALDNSYMESKIGSMREHVERGESLSRSAAQTGLFTPLVIQMVIVGEETGQVDAMLRHVAAFYEEEVEYDLGRLSTLLEPLILGILGVMVGILALGVFLPMWDMVNFVKH
ncbi:MAG: type II secretion system F family protein [Gammaproteobacteria bacterium]